MELKDIEKSLKNKDTKIHLAFILGTEAAGGIVGWFIRKHSTTSTLSSYHTFETILLIS